MKRMQVLKALDVFTCVKLSLNHTWLLTSSEVSDVCYCSTTNPVPELSSTLHHGLLRDDVSSNSVDAHSMFSCNEARAPPFDWPIIPTS
jgi:hypothetical protein